MEFKYDIYLAAPFFNEKERSAVERLATELRGLYKVYVPMEHTIEDAWNLSNNEWGKRVFDEDIRAIDNSKMVVVLDWGHYGDTGTAWECGYAYGKGKNVHRFRMNQESVYSLMMEFGCSHKDWSQYALPYFGYDIEPEVK